MQEEQKPSANPAEPAATAATGAASVSQSADATSRPVHASSDPLLQSRAAFIRSASRVAPEKIEEATGAPIASTVHPLPPIPSPVASVSELPASARPSRAASEDVVSEPTPPSPALADALSATASSPIREAAQPPSAPKVGKVSESGASSVPESVQPANAPADESEAGLELPPLDEVSFRFVTSAHYRESERALKQAFALTDDDLQFLNEMDHAVLAGVIDLPKYIAALRGEFSNFNDEEKSKLIGSLLAYRYLPFGKTVTPSAQDAAKEAGLVLPPAPYYQVYTKPMTYGGAAHEVARMAGIPLMGQAQERLRDLLISKVKGVRIDAQVEDQLARSADFGGLGLSKEKAKAAIDAMNDILGRVELMAEEEYSRWLSSAIKRAKPAPAVPSEPPAPKESDEDEREIAEIASTMPRPAKDTTSVLYRSVRATMDKIADKPRDEYLVRRLENIVSTRLRDVRSRNEVLMKLMRDVKVGGLGYAREIAEKVANHIEDGYKEFRDGIAMEEKSKIEQQLTEQEKKIEGRRRREAEEHALWYEEKIKSKRVEEEEKKQLLSRMKVIAQGYTTPLPHPVDLKEKAKERTKYGELVPAAATPTAAAPSVMHPAKPFSQAPGAKPTPPRKLPEKPMVKVSAATADLQARAQAGRPKMTDIRPPDRGLTGPLQEIGSLTLDQFRRLSADPAAAAARIKDKIDLLGQESFNKQVQGIQAWQQSPLQQMYLKLLAEAFKSGKPVNDLVTAKRAAGENVPSPEELSAIISLNAQMRM